MPPLAMPNWPVTPIEEAAPRALKPVQVMKPEQVMEVVATLPRVEGVPLPVQKARLPIVSAVPVATLLLKELKSA